VASPSHPLSPADIEGKVRALAGDPAIASSESFGEVVLAVAPGRLVDVATSLRDDPSLAFDYLDFVTGVDRGEEGIEVVVELHSTTLRHNVRLKVACESAEARCPTLSGVWPAANWHERETAEMFGVEFEGHPQPVKLLLAEQFEGHPLRKDFQLMSREAKPWPGAVEGEEEEED
jgi:NADH-quinone oxidoreductase subunit C